MHSYLKNEQHYIDLYDLHTIEQCLRWYFGIKKGMNEKRNKVKGLTKKEFDTDVHKLASYSTNVIKIQRFHRKQETLQEWMDRDRKTQEIFDNAIPPSEVFCKECFSRTTACSKDLMNAYEDDARVLFMFECIKCSKRQSLFEDGSEWEYESPRCPKCDKPLNHVSKHTKNTLVTIDNCTKCDYKNKDVYNFKKSADLRRKKEKRDHKLLSEYREEFCLSEDEGQKAVLNLDSISRFVDEMKEKEKKEKDPVYQKAKKLKNLKIGQLKELLEKAVYKEGYEDLHFGKPEMGQYVIVDFTLSDNVDSRTEQESVSFLKKLIKKLLEDTTWRLMSDGISYRLGILSGRLKAYESEEDLVKIVPKSV